MLKKIYATLLVMLVAISLVACSNAQKFKAGTFTAEAKGFNAGEPIVVEVTTTDEGIADVKVLSHAETDGIGSVAVDKLPTEIVKTQSIKVDLISGATFTSNAILEAVSLALKDAGVDASKLEPKTDNTISGDVTKDVDVVIVGAGGAGMTAAITAAKEGKSVLIIEKGSMVGGNSSRATGGMNAAKTQYQDLNDFAEDSGIEKTIANAKEKYPELSELIAKVESQYNEYKANPQGYFDSVELYILDTMVGGKGLNDLELVNTLAANSEAAIEWLAKLDTAINLNNVSSFGGASVKRIHRPVDENNKVVSVGAYMIPLLETNATDAGAEILMNTTATEIIMDANKVVGIKANDGNANYTINAKSVVLASGGFAGNLEMVAELKPELDGFITTNTTTCTGDGIIMAQAIGADVVDMDQIQIHPTVLQQNGALITEGLRGDGAILVNQKGERFTDEVGTRDAVSAAELAQDGGYAYLIVDQKMIDASGVIQGYLKKEFTIGGDATNLSGTDLDTLAGLMNTDAKTLKNTIETWNKYVIAKNDEDFGRTSFANTLDDKYVAIKIAPGVHHTMGGIKINEKAEVINQDGSIIEGLFAAGEVTGGVHGANRLGGNAVADFVVFGRIAGQSAAEYAK